MCYAQAIHLAKTDPIGAIYQDVGRPDCAMVSAIEVQPSKSICETVRPIEDDLPTFDLGQIFELFGWAVEKGLESACDGGGEQDEERGLVNDIRSVDGEDVLVCQAFRVCYVRQNVCFGEMIRSFVEKYALSTVDVVGVVGEIDFLDPIFDGASDASCRANQGDGDGLVTQKMYVSALFDVSGDISKLRLIELLVEQGVWGLGEVEMLDGLASDG